jgi:hypothetical protein
MPRHCQGGGGRVVSTPYFLSVTVTPALLIGAVLIALLLTRRYLLALTLTVVVVVCVEPNAPLWAVHRLQRLLSNPTVYDVLLWVGCLGLPVLLLFAASGRRPRMAQLHSRDQGDSQ